MWNAVGSFVHPERMNVARAINGFKARVVRGINGISTVRWTDNAWNSVEEDHGVTLTEEALSEIRLFPAVIAYINHPTAHRIFSVITNDLANIFQRL